MFKKFCNICNKEYLPTGKTQKYCGSIIKKNGCSYNKRLERERKYASAYYIKNIKVKIRYCKKCKKNISSLIRKMLCEDCLLENKAKKWRKKGERRLKLRFKIFKRDKFTCIFCGRKPPTVTLEIDHIFPKSQGGPDEEKNYQTLCKECNIGKGDCLL